MKKILFSLFLFVLVSCTTLNENSQNLAGDALHKPPIKERPNIIVIVLDDLGYGSLGSFGGTTIRTPNIDRIASEGMRFTNFYANAPICGPTRVSLLTGKYPLRFGIRHNCNNNGKVIPREATKIPKLLQKQEYVTGHFGKLHVGATNPITLLGYDEAITYPAGRIDPELAAFNPDGTNQRIQMKGQLTDVLTDFTLDFIQRHKKEPFFINLWYLNPHSPWTPPEEWGSLYEGYPHSERANYSGTVSFVDAKIGAIDRKLKDLGLYEKTLVIIMSDNGADRMDGSFSENSFLRYGKGLVFEGGIRVPMIARWPGKIPPGSTSDAFVLGFDIAPTLAQIVGVADKGFDGRSFIRALNGEKPLPRDDEAIVWEFKRNRGTQVAIRKGDWKAITTPDLVIPRVPPNHEKIPGGERFLFNLAEDPQEQSNLIDQRPDVFDALMEDYVLWQKKVTKLPYEIDNTEGRARKSDSLLEFTKSRGAVTLKQNPVIDVNVDDFTFSLWIKPDRTDVQSVIAMKRKSWTLWQTLQGSVALTITGEDGRNHILATKKNTLSPGEWHHITFTLWDNLIVRDKSSVSLSVSGQKPVHRNTPFPVAIHRGQERVILGNSQNSRQPFFGTMTMPEIFLVAAEENELTQAELPTK